MNLLQMIVKRLAFIAYDKLTEILKVILTKPRTYKKGFCHFAGFSFTLHQAPDMYKLLRAAVVGARINENDNTRSTVHDMSHQFFFSLFSIDRPIY